MKLQWSRRNLLIIVISVIVIFATASIIFPSKKAIIQLRFKDINDDLNPTYIDNPNMTLNITNIGWFDLENMSITYTEYEDPHFYGTASQETTIIIGDLLLGETKTVFLGNSMYSAEIWRQRNVDYEKRIKYFFTITCNAGTKRVEFRNSKIEF